MRTIKRPTDIAVTNQGRQIVKEDKSPFTLSFHDFLTMVFDSDPRCQATFEVARRVGRIDAAAIGDDPEIKVHDEDLAWLLGIMATTTLPIVPLANGSKLPLGRQLLPFLDALESSQPTAPAAPAPAPASAQPPTE